MALSLNKVFIVGNLTKDPEIRHTGQGKSVASLSVAVNESYKNKDGEWVKNTMFFNVVAWGGQADFAGKYLAKGAPVWVEGKLSTRNYENSEGKKVYITEIVASSLQSLASRTRTDDNAGDSHDSSAPRKESKPSVPDGLGDGWEASYDENDGSSGVPF